MIVSVITDAMVGGTFLSWSLHYLAGHDTYYSTKLKKVNELPTNPVTDINSHNFLPNLPLLPDDFKTSLTDLEHQHSDKFHTLYFHRFFPWEHSEEEAITHTQNAVNTALSRTRPIVVTSSRDISLYHYKLTGRTQGRQLSNYKVFHSSWEERMDDFNNTFFPDSTEHYKKLGIINIWDKREMMALNYRPYERDDDLSIYNFVDYTKPHFYLDVEELWDDLDVAIYDIFKFINKTVDTERYASWLPVYHQWKLIHNDRLRFMKYFDKIIDSIVNNKFLDLRRFELDLVREAVIQHELIYRHGLTIKNWGLDKFPDNTLELHTLLEPNVYHKVEDIYGCLV